MAYSIFLDIRAQKELDSLEALDQIRIAKVIDQLQALGPNSSQLKKLKTPLVGYRKRVGQYRILFDVDNQNLTIYRIRHRKDAYKN